MAVIIRYGRHVTDLYATIAQFAGGSQVILKIVKALLDSISGTSTTHDRTYSFCRSFWMQNDLLNRGYD